MSTQGDLHEHDAPQARLEAQAIFNRAFVALVVFAGLALGVMAIGLAANPRAVNISDPQKAEQTSNVLKSLIVLLFFSATIILSLIHI